MGTCLKNFIRGHVQARVFTKERAYIDFTSIHTKTRESYTRLFSDCSPALYEAMGEFFTRDIIYFIITGRYSFKEKLNYLKYIEALLLAYDRKVLFNIRIN